MSKHKGRGQQQSKAPLVALGVGAVAIIGFFVWAVVQSESGSAPSGKQPETAAPGGCIHSMVTEKPADIPGLEHVPCISAQHIPLSHQVQYRTEPPLSGDHYQSAVQPKFYTTRQVPEILVHNLEHGNIIIYYDESKLSGSDMDAIRKLTTAYPQAFGGVVAVPYKGDAQHPVILTAWEYGLRLTKWDQGLVDKFVATFRNKGPEQG